MAESPVVRVAEGELQGKIVSSPNQKSFYSFQGIPYAKPPLGSLRFKDPEPAEPWEGIRDATSEGNVCAQIDHVSTKQFIGDENCLFLNVYTPNLDGEFLPVMVWIHGGAFRFGSGNTDFYGADFLVEKDVVVVTLNYRYGPLGFLCLNTPEVPGNAGLKDIALALKWIKENINQFGGNTGNITVFGESAGGAAASLLMASPSTKNLFNKVILQSGTALGSLAWTNHPVESAKKLAKELGLESNDVTEIFEFLQATSVKDLTEATHKLNSFKNLLLEGNLFAPVIEKELPGVEPFISEPYSDLLTSGRLANIPVMIGRTELESANEPSFDDLQYIIPPQFNLERNSEESLAVADKIKQFYFKGQSHLSVENWEQYFKLISDIFQNIDAQRFVKYLVQVTNKPIYFYNFDYVGELNLAKRINRKLALDKAGHIDEMGYLFRNVYQDNLVPTPQDLKVRERVVRLWTNFAKTGNPTPDENHYINLTWLPVTKDNLYYLNISSELSLGTNPDKERMEFWEELYSKYYKIWEQPKSNRDEVTIIDNPAIIEDANKQEVVEAEVVIPDVVPDADTPKAEIESEIPKEVETEIQTAVEPVVQTTEVIVESAIEPKQPQEIEEEIPEKVEIEEPVKIEETVEIEEPVVEVKETIGEVKEPFVEVKETVTKVPAQNGHANGDVKKRTSNEIKMVQSNGVPKDVIRANDPPEDDLPKNIGVNKFVNFFESLGGKK